MSLVSMIIADRMESLTKYYDRWMHLITGGQDRRVRDAVLSYIEPGDRVLLAGESSSFWVHSYLGIALAGGVSVPVAVPSNPQFFAGVVQATEPRFACVQAKWLRRLETGLKAFEMILCDARPPGLSIELDLTTTDQIRKHWADPEMS